MLAEGLGVADGATCGAVVLVCGNGLYVGEADDQFVGFCKHSGCIW